MRYEQIKDLPKGEFKRLTGVSQELFARMLSVWAGSHGRMGRPSKLSRADQLLLALMYWREYRTFFHIGVAYGVSEATACRTVAKVEIALLRSGRFSLPGKKALKQPGASFSVILLDATEQPVERPKKKAAPLLQWEEEAAHQEEPAYR